MADVYSPRKGVFQTLVMSVSKHYCLELSVSYEAFLGLTETQVEGARKLLSRLCGEEHPLRN